MVTVDRLSFNEKDVKKITKEEFIKAYIPVLYPDMPEHERRKKLSDVYDMVTGSNIQNINAENPKLKV